MLVWVTESYLKIVCSFVKTSILHREVFTIKLSQLTFLLQPLISDSKSHLKLQVGLSVKRSEKSLKGLKTNHGLLLLILLFIKIYRFITNSEASSMPQSSEKQPQLIVTCVLLPCTIISPLECRSGFIAFVWFRGVSRSETECMVTHWSCSGAWQKLFGFWLKLFKHWLSYRFVDRVIEKNESNKNLSQKRISYWI